MDKHKGEVIEYNIVNLSKLKTEIFNDYGEKKELDNIDIVVSGLNKELEQISNQENHYSAEIEANKLMLREIDMSFIDNIAANINDYKTYDETNKLRFEAIETKEITNYTKILTRLKIIEDST